MSIHQHNCSRQTAGRAQTRKSAVGEQGKGSATPRGSKSRPEAVQRPCMGSLADLPDSIRSLEITKEHFGEIVAGDRLMTPAEVGTVLRCHGKTVVRLFEQGDLSGVQLNAGTGERATRRVLRGSVCLLLLKTASYTPADYIASIVMFLDSLGHAQRAEVRDRVGWDRKNSGGPEAGA